MDALLLGYSPACTTAPTRSPHSATFGRSSAATHARPAATACLSSRRTRSCCSARRPRAGSRANAARFRWSWGGSSSRRSGGLAAHCRGDHHLGASDRRPRPKTSKHLECSYELGSPPASRALCARFPPLPPPTLLAAAVLPSHATRATAISAGMSRPPHSTKSHQQASGDEAKLTTNQGIPISDNQIN